MLPAIASADSAKIAIEAAKTSVDLPSPHKTAANWQASPNQQSLYSKKRNWATWRPDTKRAMWLALVLPGAGQIYNRKYWKLPFIYGGFVGCTYAITWNNQMYHDYSQAYMDIMDNDPNTQSYNQFLHLGAQINESNIERYKEIFRKRKDKYRRWRDFGNLRHDRHLCLLSD